MLNKNLTRPIYRNATHIAKYRQINKKIFAFIIIISLLSVSTSAYSIVFQISKFTNNDTDDLGPIVYNGTIAWTGDNLGYEIFYWDGTSRTQVSATDSYNDFAHSLHNGTVAWSGNDGGPDHEIFYWDGTSVTQITDDDDHDWNPSVYYGTVAWYGYVGGG